MKTIYEAFDGKTFDTPKDCSEYEIEQMNDTLKLYGVPGETGERVQSMYPAYVAYIADCDALKVFVTSNDATCSNNYYAANVGLNVFVDGEWRPLSDNAVASLSAYFKENEDD